MPPPQQFNEWLISQVRSYMKDFAQTNKLLLEVEHTNEDITNAIVRIVGIYNNTPPPLQQITRVQDMPGGLDVFVKGCASELLKSESIKRARNHLQYADGALTINDDDKAGPYMQLAGQLGQEFRVAVQEIKRTINIQRGMRGSSSPYATLFNHYTTYAQFVGVGY